MAINSRNERACCICLALPAGGVFPSPDSTLDGADRQHIARTWRSISAAAISLVRLVYYHYRRLRL